MKIDKFDQYAYLEVTESAINTYTQEEFNLPVQLPTSGKQKGRILELTRIVAIQDKVDVVPTATTDISVQMTSDSKTAMVSLEDPDLVFKRKHYLTSIQSAAGETAILQEATFEVNLQDNKGIGILYPYDTIYLAIKGSNNTAAAKNIQLRLYYRYVDVGAAEILQLLNP